MLQMAQRDRRASIIHSRFFYGYVIITVSFLIMVVTQGTRPTYGVFFIPMIADFNWGRALISGAFSLSLGLEGIIGIVMGWLNDKFGPRLVLTLSVFFLGLSYGLMSMMGNLWQLYVFYGLISGLAFSGTYVPLVSTVARWFIGRRSAMTGLVVAGIGIGSIITPPVIERLIYGYGWRCSYLILSITVLVVGIVGSQFLRQNSGRVHQRFYGETEFIDQHRNTDGMTLVGAMQTRQFWMFSGIMACLGYSIFTAMVHIAPQAIDLGFSSFTSAGILAAMGGSSIAGNILLGNLADRIGNRRTFMFGFFLTAVFYFVLIFAKDVSVIYLIAIIFGIAYGGMGSSESPLVAKLFGLRSHGLIFGVSCFAFTSGASLGPYLTGLFFDTLGNYRVALIICAVVGVIGLVLATFITSINTQDGRKGL
jgi:MFS family permease